MLPVCKLQCTSFCVISVICIFFQLYAAVSERVPPEELGLVPGSPLLVSLKQCVVELARSSNILSTVQEAAQSVLKSGWFLLLPTVSERASALSQLLPSGDGEKSSDNLCVLNTI